MTDRPAPLPGLDEELAAGRRVVRCRVCGRPLVGRARFRGLGDGCAAKFGMRTAPGVGRFEVEQDGLFGE
jgi:hypothetical protein